MLLLIYCLLLLPLLMGFHIWSLFCYAELIVHSSFKVIFKLVEEREGEMVALIVFLMSCDC